MKPGTGWCGISPTGLFTLVYNRCGIARIGRIGLETVIFLCNSKLSIMCNMSNWHGAVLLLYRSKRHHLMLSSNHLA